MIYQVNDELRSTILDDNTAEARLENILNVMDRETFGQRKAATIVGGLERLKRLMIEGKIRWDKPTNKQNGKWFCNAADVLKYAIKPTMRRRKNNESTKRKKKSKKSSRRAA